jgi:molybdenum cofactor synthesis domain-containing protein
VSAPRAAVITCSTRAATGVYEDKGGPQITAALREWGLDADDPVVVADGEAVTKAIAAALEQQPAVLITTGGTGLTPTDRTPEATAPFITQEVPGIAEALRAAGIAGGVPSAMLSRGVTGLAGSTLVVNLPGSSGGVRDGLAVLGPVMPHILSQIGGGDH